MFTVLLIIHGLLAVALLGAITHQAASVWWPRKKPAGGFVERFRSVAAAPYANAVVLLYLLTAVLGAIIYPEFRVTIRNVVEELGHHAVMGTFELKEHFVMVGVAVLPAYWLFWRPPLGLLLSTCWRCGTTTRCSRTTRRSAKSTGAYKNRATVRRCTGMAGCQPLLWPRWALPR